MDEHAGGVRAERVFLRFRGVAVTGRVLVDEIRWCQGVADRDVDSVVGDDRDSDRRRERAEHFPVARARGFGRRRGAERGDGYHREKRQRGRAFARRRVRVQWVQHRFGAWFGGGATIDRGDELEDGVRILRLVRFSLEFLGLEAVRRRRDG